MKTTYDILSILLSASVLVSCGKEDPVMPVDTADRAITAFKSLMVGSSKNVSEWHKDDTIGISAYASGTNRIYGDLAHRRYQTSGSGLFVPLTSDDEIFYPMSNSALDFVAYHPYKTNIVNDVYRIDVNDQSSLKVIDFLYSDNVKGKNKKTPELEFIFNHRLSKIVIEAIPGNGLTEANLRSMSVTIGKIHHQATFDLSRGTLQTFGDKISVVMNTTGFRSEAIVLPGEASNVSITVTLAGSEVYRALLPTANFHAGTAHRYRAEINKTEMEIHPMAIDDWLIDENTYDAGIPNTVVYSVGDYYPAPSDPATAIGVVYWLSPGSDGQSGKILSFDTSEKMWSVNNTQIIDAVSIVSGVVNTNRALMANPTLQNFPAFRWCADKGAGWYLPARYELHILREQWGNNEVAINNAITTAGGEILSGTDIYLTSSESKIYPANMAESYSFYDKGWPFNYKTTLQRVRAVKVF